MFSESLREKRWEKILTENQIKVFCLIESSILEKLRFHSRSLNGKNNLRYSGTKSIHTLLSRREKDLLHHIGFSCLSSKSARSLWEKCCCVQAGWNLPAARSHRCGHNLWMKKKHVTKYLRNQLSFSGFFSFWTEDKYFFSYWL